MFDDDYIFENDDEIQFKDNEILLIKHCNSLIDRAHIKNKLKEYDGNWDFIQMSDETNEVLPDDWIIKNFDLIKDIYADMYNRSFYNNLFENLKVSDLTYYLDNIRTHPSAKIVTGEQYEEYKLYGMKKPSIHEWTSFFITDLHYLYSLYTHMTKFRFGSLESFIQFCYKTSDTKRLPLY